MFTELFYKLRGIDKWPTTTATVTSVEEVSTGGRSGITQNIFFTYKPANAEPESGKLYVDSYAALYGLKQGDTFEVQYQPIHPSRFYCQEAKSLSAEIRLVIIGVGVAFALSVVLIKLFGGHGR